MNTAPTITTEAKRLASVQAAMALVGIELRIAPGGGYVATRWNLTRALPTLDAAEVFANAAMDRIR